jgi:hypothetical protein
MLPLFEKAAAKFFADWPVPLEAGSVKLGL